MRSTDPERLGDRPHLSGSNEGSQADCYSKTDHDKSCDTKAVTTPDPPFALHDRDFGQCGALRRLSGGARNAAPTNSVVPAFAITIWVEVPATLCHCFNPPVRLIRSSP